MEPMQEFLEKTFAAIDTNYVRNYRFGRRDPVPHLISDLGRSRDFQVSRGDSQA